MPVKEKIANYISSQPEPKRTELLTLHQRMLQLFPKARLWFLDGKDDKGKVVSNPNIGYGLQSIKYADGSSKEFYQIGFSGNATGISVYIMGLPDKNCLPQTFGAIIGKANVTGYCIRFKKLSDINTDVLEAAIRYGIENTSEP